MHKSHSILYVLSCSHVLLGVCFPEAGIPAQSCVSNPKNVFGMHACCLDKCDDQSCQDFPIFGQQTPVSQQNAGCSVHVCIQSISLWTFSPQEACNIKAGLTIYWHIAGFEVDDGQLHVRWPTPHCKIDDHFQVSLGLLEFWDLLILIHCVVAFFAVAESACSREWFLLTELTSPQGQDRPALVWSSVLILPMVDKIQQANQSSSQGPVIAIMTLAPNADEPSGLNVLPLRA